MQRHITNECVAIAFYGVQAHAELLSTFYTRLVHWFDAVGCPPDKLSVRGPGFSGKAIGFGRANAQLQKRGFSQIDSFNVYAMLPGRKTLTIDWWATASLSLDYKPSFVLEARQSVSRLEDERLMKLVERCIIALKPVYGIGYHRNHDKGPGFYAIGLNYVTIDNVTGDDAEEVEAVSKWGYVGMKNEVYREGLIRDVYPQNYLTEPQLNMQVQGKTLEQWILSDSSRGSLTKIGQMKLWQLTAAQIEWVRGTLSESGVIFDWNAYEGLS